MALDLYKCETLLPEGSADVLVEGYQQGDVIEMDFLNNALGRVIEGSFVINFVDKKTESFMLQVFLPMVVTSLKVFFREGLFPTRGECTLLYMPIGTIELNLATETSLSVT